MSECEVVLLARREAGAREFEVTVDAEYAEHLIDGMVALVDEVCSVTGLYAEDVIARMQERI